MQLYKNIVFDLGNVILNIDPMLSFEAFKNLGINNFDRLYTLSHQEGLFDSLETGMAGDEFYCNEIRRLSGSDLSNTDIIAAWNALILDFPRENLELLKRVKSKYRTFILSNTNHIHYSFYTSDLRENHQVKGLEELVQKAYFSHEVGLRKPDEAIFRYVEEDAAILPSETLFIDDSDVNCEAARKRGWNVILYSGRSLPELFREIGLPY